MEPKKKGKRLSKLGKVIISGIIVSVCGVLTWCGNIEQYEEEFIGTNRVKGVTDYDKGFNDLNDTQLVAAQMYGIPMLTSRETLSHHSDKLLFVSSSDTLKVDKLTHSMPYLVPRAHRLLAEIGQNFRDSLQHKGIAPYRIIVTSILRSAEDIKKLQQGNTNASSNSTHTYGTTFDISWKRYDKDSLYAGNRRPANEVQLKKVLAEVLRDLRDQERCYIKHEKKQACFHITTR